MSLDLNKLEKVREFADGKMARCPACAEAGQDRKGEHLRIYPDGKFGCCVHPGDSEHRKRIFALAGLRGRRGITVRVAAGKNGGSVQGGILGRLGRVFVSPSEVAEVVTSSDASDGVNEVEPTAEEVRTLRTGEIESSQDSLDLFRTPRTPSLPLTRIANEIENSEKEEREERELKEFRPPVRSVREQKERLPHLLSDGTLVIPFDSPERYHWWKSGQSVSDTLKEVKERMNDAAAF